MVNKSPQIFSVPVGKTRNSNGCNLQGICVYTLNSFTNYCVTNVTPYLANELKVPGLIFSNQARQDSAHLAHSTGHQARTEVVGCTPV